MNVDRSSPGGSLQQGDSLGSKIWPIAQRVIGSLVVAGLVWLAADRISAWSRINNMERLFERHELEGKNRHTVLDIDINRLYKLVDEISEEIIEMKKSQQNMMIEIAKLPPDEWEKRIIDNERNITELKSKSQ